VRARDVSWVSSVWHVTWITLPVIALACIPQIFDTGGGQFSGTVVLQAAVFAAGTALVARELLRRREIEADRQAARWLDSPEPLCRLLETLAAKGTIGLLRSELAPVTFTLYAA